MKSLQTHQYLLVFLFLILALTCVISPWMALGADWFAERWPEVMSERVPFSRIFNRSFMIAGIIVFIFGRRVIFPARLKALLPFGSARGWRNILTGWTLGVVSIASLVTAMSVADIFTPFFRLTWDESLSRIVSAFFAGIFTGFFEEVFFRGILFLGLRQQGWTLGAYILVNLFYSLLHFVKPGESYFLDGMNPLAGFRHLFKTFEPFLDILSLVPGILGLLLIGVVLSYALERTGNLCLSIGLHAGWVFSLKIIRVFGDFTRDDLGWAFGSTDPKIVSGIVSWLGILLVAVAIHRITRGNLDRAAGQPPGSAA